MSQVSSLYALTAAEAASYDQVFAKVDLDADGFLTGKEAAKLLARSGLPRDDLATIWRLADQDRDGQLNRHEFRAAMHLIVCASKRKLPLPITLPPALHSGGGAAFAVGNDSHISASGAAATAPSPASGLEAAMQRVRAERSSILNISTTTPANSRRAAAAMTTQPPPQEAIKPSLLAPPRARRSSVLEELRYVNIKSVDAVFAETDRARQALRDVRSPTALLANLDDLSKRRDRLKAAALAGRQLRARRHSTSEPAGERQPPSPREAAALHDADAPAVTLTAEEARLSRRSAGVPGSPPMSPASGRAHRKASLLLPGRDPEAAGVRARVEKAAEAERVVTKSLQQALRRWGIAEGSQKLDLKGVPLRRGDVDALVEILRQNLDYSELDLSGGDLPTSTAAPVASALAFNTTVRTLMMERCHVSDASARAIAEMITVNRGLRELSFRGCDGLSRRGLDLLLRALDRNKRVACVNGLYMHALRQADAQVLDLSGWPLPYLDALLVAHQLRHRGDGLVHVDLSGSSISSDGFRALADALLNVGTTTLERLRLRSTRLDGRAIADVCRLAGKNPDLVEIDLSENPQLRLSAYEPYGRELLALLTPAIRGRGSSAGGGGSGGGACCGVSGGGRGRSSSGGDGSGGGSSCGDGSNMDPGSSGNCAALSLTMLNLSGSGADAFLIKSVNESLAVNRALREEPKFAEYLEQRYAFKAIAPLVPAVRDCRVLRGVDEAFMRQEGLPGVELCMGAGLDGGYSLRRAVAA